MFYAVLIFTSRKKVYLQIIFTAAQNRFRQLIWNQKFVSLPVLTLTEKI